MSENNGESPMDLIREALADAQLCIEQSHRALLRALKDGYEKTETKLNRPDESETDD